MQQEQANHFTTAALILAAGSSRRMGEGRHKLLLPLGGRPVLAHVIEATLASQARPIVLVLGHQAEQVRMQVATLCSHPSIFVVENPDYLQGMSTSLRVGLQALTETLNKLSQPSYSINGALIVLGDQPLMTHNVIDTLIATKKATGKHIITPLYAGKRGSPVLFDRNLFPELMKITGDEGGKRVIERYRQKLVTVELGDPFTNYDVDTWEAYQEVVAQWEQRQEEHEKYE